MLFSRNKKGILALTTVLGIAIMITVILFSQSRPFEQTLAIGEKQSFLIQAYSYGEITKKYVADSADLALRGSLYNFGQYGLRAEQFCDPDVHGLDVISCGIGDTTYFICSDPPSELDSFSCGHVEDTCGASYPCTVEVPISDQDTQFTEFYSCDRSKLIPTCAQHTCGASDNGYLFWRRGAVGSEADCTPTVAESEDEFIELFDSYLTSYLVVYPTLPFSTFYEGSLVDEVRFEYELDTESLSIEATPGFNEFNDFAFINDEGDVETADLRLKTGIAITEDSVDLDYKVNSFTSASLPINFGAILSNLIDGANAMDLSCISGQNCNMGSALFDFEYTYNNDVVEIDAKYPASDPFEITVHTGDDFEEAELVFKLAFQQ